MASNIVMPHRLRYSFAIALRTNYLAIEALFFTFSLTGRAIAASSSVIPATSFHVAFLSIDSMIFHTYTKDIELIPIGILNPPVAAGGFYISLLSSYSLLQYIVHIAAVILL